MNFISKRLKDNSASVSIYQRLILFRKAREVTVASEECCRLGDTLYLLDKAISSYGTAVDHHLQVIIPLSLLHTRGRLVFQFEYCHLAGRLRARMRRKEHKTSCLMCNKPLVTYKRQSFPGSPRMDR
jgi:hypothetical protein